MHMLRAPLHAREGVGGVSAPRSSLKLGPLPCSMLLKACSMCSRRRGCGVAATSFSISSRNTTWTPRSPGFCATASRTALGLAAAGGAVSDAALPDAPRRFAPPLARDMFAPAISTRTPPHAEAPRALLILTDTWRSRQAPSAGARVRYTIPCTLRSIVRSYCASERFLWPSRCQLRQYILLPASYTNVSSSLRCAATDSHVDGGALLGPRGRPEK